VEEIKQQCGLEITNDKVYMSTTFAEFTEMLVMNARGEDQEEEFYYEAVSQRQWAGVNTWMSRTLTV